MADDRVEVEEGQEVVRRTIVGGRPRARPSIRMRVPIGLEKVLVRAAGDPAFRDALMRDRLAAVEAMGWALEASEAAALGSVPDAVLSSMIRHIDLDRHTARRFGSSVAAAAFASVALTASTEGCDGAQSMGIDPGHWEEVPEYRPDAGILPDEGTDLDVQEPAADLGITDEGSDEAVLDVDQGPQVGGITPDEGPQEDAWVPPEVDDLLPQD